MSVSPPLESCRPHPDVIARRVGRGGILVHLGTGAVFELNETGLRVWDLLVAGIPAASLADRLADDYTGRLPDIATDIENVLSDLVNRGLLVS